MVSSRDLLLPESMFSTYLKVMAYVTILKPMVRTVVPQQVQNFVVSYINSLVGSRSSTLTLIINERDGTARNGIRIENELYSAAQAYLSSKISPDASELRITRDPNNKKVNLYLSQGGAISDIYQGIELKWRFLAGTKKQTTVDVEGQYEENVNWECLQLSFNKKHTDLVLNSYVPYVEKEAKMIKNENKILKMHTYDNMCKRWNSVNFEHPSTFDTMAMNDELKRSVMKDLDRFIKRKDFYKRVGKAWKRGYLLYGPPGTGKTSLVAAMANYLKFDIYDLQLANVQGDTDLRKLLLTTKNNSILVVEDIDCSVDLPTRLKPSTKSITKLGVPKESTPLTLSGLLNCIDGLWSSCGDERIIIFTTNNKEKLDEALLRPGRMDMHIYLGHCCFEGFKTLASNYLGLSPDNDDTHHLYPEIKQLIDGQVLTPAQVAEELMKDEDADMALENLVRVLKRKRSEPGKSDDESNKKMKRFEEVEMRISEDDETLRGQMLTQVEDKEELIGDEDD